MGTNQYGFIFDNIGNRETYTNNSETLTYLANSLNQYTNIADGVTNTPTYDLDGNMLTHNDWTYSWNGENRMVQASNATHVIEYSYDFSGRMFEKVTDGETNNLVWDGFDIIAECSNSQTNYNVFGLDLSGSLQGAGGIGGLLATIQDGETYFTAFDANGNLTEYVGTNGTIVAHREYSPFGVTIALTGTKKDDFTHWWSTKPWDAITGMSEYELRKYLVELGRWPSRDPIGEEGGYNLYAFVLNDSINWVDDNGLRRRRGRRRRWGNLAGAHRFIWHFYTGGGDAVDIGDWGYLGRYRSARDVQVYECEARNEARASVDDCCAEDGTQWEGSYTRLVDGTDGLFVMGNGNPNADWTCTMDGGSVSCDISYDITDSFEDPVDLESQVNRRLPGWLPRIPDWIVNLGGTPYPLTASWEDTVDGCSEPEDCESAGDGRRRRRRDDRRRRRR